MSSVDVGDAVELVFTTAAGATVEVTWLDPDETTVFSDQPVTETPTGSGRYPFTVLPARAGTWTALFTASGTATAVERLYIRASAVTGPPPLAVVGDVTDQYGPLTPAQEGLISALLRAASKLVRARFPRVDAHLTAGLLDPDVVALAITNMVLRVLRNPGGLRAETIGPFSRTYDTGDAAGLLTITAQEQAMLTPVTATTAAVAVGTIMMRPGLAPPPVGVRRGCW